VQSPDLKVLRAQASVTRAQAFAAGLLPDPVVGLSQDRPSAGQQGASTAYTHGVSWDVGSLVTFAARQTARRRTDEQVDLSLLWAEWQTVAESRLQFVRIQRGRELVARLAAESAALEPLTPHLNAALQRGVITFDVATTGLSAASDVARQLTEARDTLANREQDLRVLLGLPPAEALQLVGDVDVPPIAAAAADAALEALPRRRPDLRALALGYSAEEARVRAAILGQFPAVNFGVSRSRDNTGISSNGFSLAVSLPLFDANRGAIRIERATREQLHEEYAQRLLSARAEVARLLSTQQLLAAREAELAPYVATLEATTAQAARAYERGSMDWTVYLGLRQSALAAAVELITLREMLAETRIGLATLLSGDWAAGTDNARGAAT
jgi:outer membrane protein TolC